VSWWNPFSWGPGGPGDAEPDGQDGIWGGVGGAGFHPGSVLGEGQRLGGEAAAPVELPPLVPSELALALGSAGAGILAGDDLGELRVAGAGLGDPAPVFMEPPGAAREVAEDAGAGLGDEGPSANVDAKDWRRDIAD
jgi:hypothetical protein